VAKATCYKNAAASQRIAVVFLAERDSLVAGGSTSFSPRYQPNNKCASSGGAAFVLCRGAALHGSPAFQGRDNNTNNRLCRVATIDARSSAIHQEIIHASLRDAVDSGCIASGG
jgi:hypothetical protein